MTIATHREFVYPEITIEHFESADIDPDQFNHEAHVYVAWLYVREYELAKAKETLSRYYSDACLFSGRARERFVLPDKLASTA